MTLSRRHLAAAGALALVAPALIRSAHAQSADEATVKNAVEELRMAWLKQDKAKIESLTAEQLSYSHSDAHLEDKTSVTRLGGVLARRRPPTASPSSRRMLEPNIGDRNTITLF